MCWTFYNQCPTCSRLEAIDDTMLFECGQPCAVSSCIPLLRSEVATCNVCKSSALPENEQLLARPTKPDIDAAIIYHENQKCCSTALPHDNARTTMLWLGGKKPVLRWLFLVPHLDKRIPDWPQQASQPARQFLPSSMQDEAWQACRLLGTTPVPTKWRAWYHQPFGEYDVRSKRYLAVQDQKEWQSYDMPLPYEPWMCYCLRHAALYGLSAHNSGVAGEKWRIFQEMYVGWRAADARNSGAVDTGRASKGEVRRAAAASAYEQEVAILRSGPDAEFPLSQEIIDAGLQQTYAALRASFYKLTIGVRRVAVIAPSAPVPLSLPSIQELLADPRTRAEWIWRPLVNNTRSPARHGSQIRSLEHQSSVPQVEPRA